MAESFADTLVEAYRSSPEMQSQRSRVNISGERAVQARAGGRVSVTGTAGIESQVSNNDDYNMPFAFNLEIVQPLYTGGTVENQTIAAERRITVAEADMKSLEQDVLLSAAVAYLDIRRDEELVRVSRNSVRVLQEELAAARERFEVGEITRTDVEQAQARLAAQQGTLAADMGQLENSRDAYRRAVGRSPGDLDPPPPIPELPESEEEAVVIGLQNHPDLLADRLEREAAGYDVKAAIGRLLPQITLEGNVGETDTFYSDFDGFRNASVGVFVTIPFYSGGSNYSLVREAQAGVDLAESEISTTIRDIIQDIGDAWAQLRVARAEINAGRLQVRAAQLAFEGVQEEAKVGARTTLDVLDAEQEVLDAKAGLIDAQRDELVSAYALLSSMGLMTVDHLGLDVGTTYGSEEYYESVRNRNFGYDQTDDTVWTLNWRP
ncbi:TolC family outer membrane protein [Rhodobacteraceae bacterium NNCM2]|nr:TolC family outer membrane protein [Coraliihabitans acroporae]